MRNKACFLLRVSWYWVVKVKTCKQKKNEKFSVCEEISVEYYKKQPIKSLYKQKK